MTKKKVKTGLDPGYHSIVHADRFHTGVFRKFSAQRRLTTEAGGQVLVFRTPHVWNRLMRSGPILWCPLPWALRPLCP